MERNFTHGNGCFPGSGLSADKHGSPGDFSLLYHIHDDTSGAACGFLGFVRSIKIYLADHTLGDLSWLQGIVKAEASDMRVSVDSLVPGYVFDFSNFWICHLGYFF